MLALDVSGKQTVRYEPDRYLALGNADSNISDRVKAYIQQDNVMVCGVIGVGTTIEHAAEWNTPLNNVVGGLVDGVNNGLQLAGASGVLKSSILGTQIWNDNQHLSISLVLELYALHNASKEVESAISWLTKFMSPELTAFAGGQAPRTVMLNMRGRVIFPRCVVKSISEPHDCITDPNGSRLSASVTLQMETERVMSKSDL